MASNRSLVLVASEMMDGNKKEDRNENGLVRMAAAARDYMGFVDDSVEVWDNTSADRRLNSSVLLGIFKAYSADLKKARTMIESGELEPDSFHRIGFVTTKTYNRVLGGSKGKIRVSDRAEDTVIGADPEFLLFDKDGNVVRANNIPGFDKIGKLGCDGAMAELRPDPAITPEGLVSNIKSIFSNNAQVAKIQDYIWKSGVYYKDAARDYPIGGHIHVGNPAMVAKMAAKDRIRLFKTLNKVLDELLAVPMTRLDGDYGMNRRTMCQMGKYGYFGEFRECNGRLEHRTLSGVWFSHPKLATLVLGVAKAIIDETFKHLYDHKFDLQYILPDAFINTNLWVNGFNGWKDIPLAADMGCNRSSDEMNGILNSSKMRVINKPFLAGWYKILRGMSTYAEYAKYIDALHALLKSSEQDIKSLDMNLRANWLEGKKFAVNL